MEKAKAADHSPGQRMPAGHDDQALWLAYNEAKALIQLDKKPPGPKP
jgi:hypothetical protein